MASKHSPGPDDLAQPAARVVHDAQEGTLGNHVVAAWCLCGGVLPELMLLLCEWLLLPRLPNSSNQRAVGASPQTPRYSSGCSGLHQPGVACCFPGRCYGSRRNFVCVCVCVRDQCPSAAVRAVLLLLQQRRAEQQMQCAKLCQSGLLQTESNDKVWIDSNVIKIISGGERLVGKQVHDAPHNQV